MTVIKFILAILFPPASVLLEVGVGGALFVNILLTILGLLPGMVHALWILRKQAEQLPANS